MNSRHLRNKVAGTILAFSILFGIGIASSMTAQAQFRNDDYYRRNNEREQRRRQRELERQQRRRNNDDYYGQQRRTNNGGYYGNDGYNGRSSDGYGNFGGSFDLRQTALNAGANEGNKAGRRDRQRGNRYDFTDEGAYREATKDYSSRLGDREIYRRYFREAFSHGYADGYNGY